MGDLDQLYQSVILDHNRSPRNCHAMPGADRFSEGYNPLCGDRLTVWLTGPERRRADPAPAEPVPAPPTAVSSGF